MVTKRTKEFAISDIDDLEKIDHWWASLLRKGPKEINSVEWISNGDLLWLLRITWSKLDIESEPFNICMPAYSSFSSADLEELIDSYINERASLKNSLKLFKNKIDDWEVAELSTDDISLDESHDAEILDFAIDPNLSYATKLDTVEKIMVSEFLWPCYKSLCRTLLMCEARIEELKKELNYRKDTTYTIVRVDRGMLRTTFKEQIGYDNKWLFATDDELLEDYKSDDEQL